MNPRSLKIGLIVAALCTGLALPASGAVKPKPKKKKPAAAVIKACANKKTGALRVRKRRYCRRSERAVVWSVRGPRGPKGASGVAGSSPGGNGGSAYFSTLGTGYSSTLNPGYTSVTGTTPVTPVETAVQTLSPAVGFTADRLAVRTSTAPETGSITVTLRANGADTGLSCTIPPGEPDCSNTTAAVVIPAGSTLSLQASSTGTVLPTNLLAGFRGR